MTTPLPFLLVSVLLVFLARGGSTRPEGGMSTKVSTAPALKHPDPNLTQRMREFKTEVLKSRILNEVNLLEPPAINAPVHLPQNVINLLVNKEAEESILGEGENLIAYPLNENTSCGNETLCSRFEFELPSENRPIASMHLWIRKMAPSKPIDLSVCITSSLDEEDRACEYSAKMSEVKSELGWTIFELSQKDILEPRSDQLFCTVNIFGSPIQVYGDQKPFLVANMNAASAERKRRSASSSSNKNCTCCLVDCFVSFKEIGWHWVVAPLGFNANMCLGKCSNQINSYPSHYHRMLSTILNNKTSTVEKKEDMWTPCCSPTKLSPLNMIYVAGNNTNTNSSSSFIYHKIPDMITESCGCW